MKILSPLCAVMLLAVFSLLGDASDLAVRPWTEPTSPVEHLHIWTPTDCVTPLYCKECGKMMGDSLGHQLVNGDILGYVTCTVCGNTTKSTNLLYGT